MSEWDYASILAPTSGLTPQANDPYRMSRRIRMIQAVNPLLRDNPDVAAQIVNQTMDLTDVDMMRGVDGALTGQVLMQTASRLSQMPAPYQRGVFASYDEATQQRLRSAGYQPPEAEDEHAWWQTALAAPLKVIGSGFGIIGDATEPIFEPIGAVAHDVYDFIPRVYRAAQYAEDTSPETGGWDIGAFLEGWKRVDDGETYIRKGVVAEVRAEFASLKFPGSDENPDYQARYVLNPADLAVRIAQGETSTEAIAEQMSGDATHSSQEYQQAAYEIERWKGDPDFQAGVAKLNEGHVTIGKGFAEMLGLRPSNPYVYDVVSGAFDATQQIILDPLNLVAPLVQGVRLGRYGVEATRWAQGVDEVFANQAKVRAAFGRMAELAPRFLSDNLDDATRAIQEFRQTFPRLVNATDVFIEAARTGHKLDTAEDIRDLFAGYQKMQKILLAGAGQKADATRVLLPTLTRPAELRASARTGMRDTIDWLADGPIYARQAKDAKLRGLEDNFVERLAPGGRELTRLERWITETGVHKVRTLAGPSGQATGQYVNLNPLTNMATFLRGFVTPVMKERTIKLWADDAFNEWRALAESTALLDLPSWHRRQMLTTMMQAPTDGPRRVAAQALMAELAAVGRITDTDAGIAFFEKFVQNHGMQFAQPAVIDRQRQRQILDVMRTMGVEGTRRRLQSNRLTQQLAELDAKFARDEIDEIAYRDIRAELLDQRRRLGALVPASEEGRPLSVTGGAPETVDARQDIGTMVLAELANTGEINPIENLGTIPGLTGMHGLLPHSDRGFEMQVPDLETFFGMSRRNTVLRQMLGVTQHSFINTTMAKAWKPSVLLRLAFIPRAAGEEMLATLLRHPISLIGGQFARAAAGDTPESLARFASMELERAGRDVFVPSLGMAGRSITPRDLDAAWAAIEQAPLQRFYPNYDLFTRDMLANQRPETEVLRTLFGMGRTSPQAADVVRRYFQYQVRAPEQLLTVPAFQWLTGLTGHIARPWDLEIATRRQMLLDEFPQMDEMDALREAKKQVDELRKSWRGLNPLFRAVHNMLDQPNHLLSLRTDTGLYKSAPTLSARMDWTTRSIAFHMTQSYRGALRRIIPDEMWMPLQTVANLDVIKRAFLDNASAGHVALYDSSMGADPLLKVDLQDASGHGTTRYLRRDPSNYEVYTLLDAYGNYDPLAVMAWHQQQLHAMNDPVMQQVAEVAAWHLDDDLARELAGTNDVALPREYVARTADDSRRAAVTQIDDDVAAFAQLGPRDREMYLEALRQNDDTLWTRFESENLGIDHGPVLDARPRSEAAIAMSERIKRMQRMSDHARAFMYNAYAAVHISPELGYGAGVLRRGTKAPQVADRILNEFPYQEMQDAAFRALSHPDNLNDVMAMERAHVGSITGRQVAHTPPPGHVRFYAPLIDKELLAGHSPVTLVQALANVPMPDRQRRMVGALLRDALNAERGIVHGPIEVGGLMTHAPFGSTAFSSSADAERVSELIDRALREASNQPASQYETLDALGRAQRAPRIGFVDVPVEETVARHKDARLHTAFRLDDIDGVAQVHFNDPLALYKMEPVTNSQRITLDAQTGARTIPGDPDAILGNGISHDDALSEWATQIWQRYLEVFATPGKERFLHASMVPALWDQKVPLAYTSISAPKWRSTLSNIYKHSADELPRSIYGPRYVLGDDNWWARFVRWGFDSVIGSSMNTLVRKPIFYWNTMRAYPEIHSATVAMRDPELWGDERVVLVDKLKLRERGAMLPYTTEVEAAHHRLAAEVEDGYDVLLNPSDEMRAAITKRFPDWNGKLATPSEPIQRMPLDPGVDTNWKELNDRNLDELSERMRRSVGDSAQMPTPPLLDPWLDQEGNLDAFRNWLVQMTDRSAALHEEALALAWTLDGVEHVPSGVTRRVFHPGKPRFDLISHTREVRARGRLHDVADTIAARGNPGSTDPFLSLEDMVDEYEKLPIAVRENGVMAATEGAVSPYDAATDERILRFGGAVLNNPTHRATMNAAIINRSHMREVEAELLAQRATHLTTPWIDDARLRSQYSVMMKNLTPFWFAEELFLKRWARVMSHSPQAYHRAQLIMTGLRDIGIVRKNDQGEDIYVVPGTPALMELSARTFGRVPIMGKIFGGAVSMPVASMLTGQVQYATPGLDRLGVPGFSPLLAIPMKWLYDEFPETRAYQTNVFGERSAGTGIVRTWVPTSIMRFIDAQTDSRALRSAQVAALQFLAANGDVPDEDAPAHVQQVFLDRVRNQAKFLLMARAIFGFVMPASPEMVTVGTSDEAFNWRRNLGADGMEEDLSPEYYALVRNLGPTEGTAEFLRRHPDPLDKNLALAWTVSRSQSDSGAPLSQTTEAYHFMQENRAWLEQFPLASGWLLPQPLTGENESGDRRAYNEQLALELRQGRAPKEMLDAIYFKTAAEDYFTMQRHYERQLAAVSGPTSFDVAERKRLRAEWQTTAQSYNWKHPIFERELTGSDRRAQRDAVMRELEVALNDPGAPPVDDAPVFLELLQAVKEYELQTMSLWGDSRSQAVATREQYRNTFINYGEQLVATSPLAKAFWRNMIVPSLNLGTELRELEDRTGALG